METHCSVNSETFYEYRERVFKLNNRVGTSEHEYHKYITSDKLFYLFLLADVLKAEWCDPFLPFCPLQKKFGIDNAEHAQNIMAALDTFFFFTMSAHVSAATPLSTNSMTPNGLSSLTEDSMWDISLINFSVNRRNRECNVLQIMPCLYPSCATVTISLET